MKTTQPGHLVRKTPDLTRQGADIESPDSRDFHLPEWQYVCGLSFIVLLTLAAYARIATFQFLNWDDSAYIVQRPEIRNGFTFAGVRWAFTTFTTANWHPLTWLSYMLDIQVCGLHPGTMHLTNLVLHCCNTVLVAFVVRGLTNRSGLALGIAAFFGVHPQHVEVVAWVSERKELLGVFFGLLTMVAWQRFTSTRRKRDWLMAHVLFTLSLLSKQMLVTMPFLLIVLAACPLKAAESTATGYRDLWKRIPGAAASVWLFFLLTLVFTISVFAAQRSGGAVVSFEHLSLSIRLANAVQSTFLYLVQTFLPFGLNPFYRHPVHDVSDGLTLLSSIFLIAITLLVWAYRNRPGCMAGWLWYLGTLVPVLGLVQLGAAARADRYTYFPHIGLFLLIGSMPVFHRVKFQRIAIFAIGVTAVGFSYLTYCQSLIWHDSISLWRASLQGDPDSYRGHDLLASALLVEEQIPEALCEARIAVDYPENRVAGSTYTTLGCAQLFSGDLESAVKNLREAIRIRPDDYRALINLGYALRMTDLSESKRLFAQALEYSPMSVEAMGNLANCEAEQGNFAAAIELLRTAMKIDSENNQLKENLRTFQEAQRLNPSP